VLPRFGHLASRPIYVYLPELAEHDHRGASCALCHDGQNIWMIHIAVSVTAAGAQPDRDELTREGKRSRPSLSAFRTRTRASASTHRGKRTTTFSRIRTPITCRCREARVDRKFQRKKIAGTPQCWVPPWADSPRCGMAHKLSRTFVNPSVSARFQFVDRRKAFVEFVRERERQDLAHLSRTCGTVRDGAPQSAQGASAYLARGWREGEDLRYFETRAVNTTSAAGAIVCGARSSPLRNATDAK